LLLIPVNLLADRFGKRGFIGAPALPNRNLPLETPPLAQPELVPPRWHDFCRGSSVSGEDGKSGVKIPASEAFF